MEVDWVKHERLVTGGAGTQADAAGSPRGKAKQ